MCGLFEDKGGRLRLAVRGTMIGDQSPTKPPVKAWPMAARRRAGNGLSFLN